MATPEVKSARVARSMELFERARRLIPGGTQLISRRPSKFAFGVSPVFAARARGARIRDVDGNEYVDWVSGIGAIILGYCDRVVDEAVIAQIHRGVGYSLNHQLELELAEELCRAVPCAEMVRYAKSGGEACAIAVRIARGATGRDTVLFCGYHGWHDWYLSANLSAEESLDSHLFTGIAPTGVPAALKGTAIPFAYGDTAALGELLDRHRGKVAAVIMEPMRSELPPDGYLAQVAALAREHGAILIFDEVSTGFRLSAGGVQPALGVTPDMAVFAKSISNGYPMAAVVGRSDVMEPAARMFISSTYWSDPIGLTAALTTLREVRRRDVPAIVQDTGAALQQELTAAAANSGLAARCTGTVVHPYLKFEVEDPEKLKIISALYIQEMAKRGCHGYTSFYLNAAQGDEEIDLTVAAARETFAILRDALDSGRPEALLECELPVDSFQRLVR